MSKARSVVVSAIATIALVVGVATPVQAAPSAVVPVVTPPDTVVPLVDVKSTTPQGTFTVDQPAAVVSGKVVSGRTVQPTMPTISAIVATEPVGITEYSNTYSIDGVKTTRFDLQPLNVKVNGKWQDVSTKLMLGSKGGWGIEAHPMHPQFAASASATDPFRVTVDGYTISMSLRDVRSVTAERRSSGDVGENFDEVFYRNALPGADLTYNVDRGGVKETVVLKSVPSGNGNRWVWDISAPGLTMATGQNGSIVFKNSSGVVKATIPNLVMWDSSGVSGVREPELVNCDESRHR